jgi:hypothetical protein
LLYGWLVVFAGSAATPAGAACAPPSAGIVSWWPAEGTANDIAGSNNAALHAPASASTPGLVGTAFGFDGTNAYVQVPDAPGLRPTNFTIEAWVKFTALNSAGSGGSPAGDQYIVFRQNSRTSDFEGFDLSKTRIAGGDAFRFLIASSSGQSVQLISSTLISTGAWYHIAALRGTNYVQLYVNGQLERQTNIAFAQDYGSYPLYFGTSGQSSWDHKLSGALDEVAIYNRALSSNEIAGIYQAGAAGKCRGSYFLSQPQSQTVVRGSNVTFAASATGTPPLSYQWQFNGADIPAASATSLSLINVQSANNGSYTLVVTNPVGAITSSPALLTVIVPPIITAQPLSQTNPEGTSASFTATATSGNGTLSYLWLYNGAPFTGDERVTGAATNVLQITPLQAGDAGSYQVIVANAAGSVTSDLAILAVPLIPMPPGIVTQPASQTVPTGENAYFRVTASGSSPLSYQWQKAGGNLVNGTEYAGVTSNTLTVVNLQTNDSGSYRVVVTNAYGAVTSAAATLAVYPGQVGVTRAETIVLVNSHSAGYADFQHFIQPYLDNFGFPYTVSDISTNPPGPELQKYSLIIIGHAQLDPTLTYLTPSAQTSISLAVSNGIGLVNFDNQLSNGTAGRYQFLQDIFGFTYGTGANATSASLPPTEAGSTMHYVTALHPANDTVTFRDTLAMPGITAPSKVTTLASNGGRPLVGIVKYGQGRAVQWGSYNWMVSTVLGPADGLDDLLWRGFVWAARKPFVMRGMPNLVSMRFDDCEGNFWWARIATEYGFRPFLTFFINSISEASAADLRNLVTNGLATASIHSFSSSTMFYFNHQTESPNSDSQQAANFAAGTQWHQAHGIPMSKVCATHYSEIGPNAFAGLQSWGIEFVPLEVVPGTVEYASPGAPWIAAGPYRLYETPKEGQVNWPTYYADFLTVPGHPEFDGVFFNVYSEIRDAGSCGEWCPDNDVAGSISRGTTLLKRSLDSMIMATIFSHEWYVHPTTCCSTTTISTNNWRAILSGITNNLAAYHPIFVTLDYASQYTRATRTSRLAGCVLDATTGRLTATFTGKTDLNIGMYVYTGDDQAISSQFVTIPQFGSGSTNIVATFPPKPLPPDILLSPASVAAAAGSSLTLSVVANGTPPLSYRWFHNSVPMPAGNSLIAGDGSTLVLTGVDLSAGGTYSVVVTNSAGSSTSGPASVVVVTPPTMASFGLLPDNTSFLTLSGVSNVSYRIDGSTNFINWDPLTNLPNPNGTVLFIDRDATNFPSRFYRAVWAP